MKYSECTTAYDVGGPIQIGLNSGDTRWSNRFDFIIDGTRVAATSRSQQCIQMLAEFVNAVVRDEVPAAAEISQAADWQR